MVYILEETKICFLSNSKVERSHQVVPRRAWPVEYTASQTVYYPVGDELDVGPFIQPMMQNHCCYE